MVSAAIALSGSPAYAEEQLSDQNGSSNPILQISQQKQDLHKSAIDREILLCVECSAPHTQQDDVRDRLAQANPTPQEPLEITPEPIFEPSSELQPSEPTSDPVSSETDLSETDLLDSDLPDLGLSEPEAADLSSDPIPSKGWQFSLSPYFFAPFDINADITVSGLSTSIDVGLDDILNLDRVFNGGLRFEGQSNRWGFILDGFYLYAEDSGNLGGSFSARNLVGFVRQTSPGRLDEFVQQFDPQRLEQLTQIGQQIGQQVNLDTPVPITASGTASVRQIRIDAAVSYRAVDMSLDNSPDANFYPRLVIAPLAGLRTNFLRQTIEVDSIRIANREIPENAIPSVDREFRESVTLVDPLLGAEIALALSDRWSLELQGDISGFGLGADRNLGWNLAFGTQFNISRTVGLQLLYRFNGFDYADGDGRDRIELDLEQNGLLLTTTFRF